MKEKIEKTNEKIREEIATKEKNCKSSKHNVLNIIYYTFALISIFLLFFLFISLIEDISLFKKILILEVIILILNLIILHFKIKKGE